MIHKILLSVLVAFSISVKAQTDSMKVRSIEVQPEYPGGYARFYKFIQNSLVYPELATLIGTSGRVVIDFIVEKDGLIGHVKPTSCVGAGCEAEAVRIVESSPKWKPGIQDGKPVRVSYSMPIQFSIYRKATPLREFERSSYGFVFL